MGQLFDALLNLSRLDAGVIEPRWQVFPINQLLDQIRAEYAPQAVQKGLALHVRPCKFKVYSDPVLLDRILRNLVSNAIVHTKHGRVLVGCRRIGDQLRIDVWDTGPGIPKKEQERIFWEFHQLGNPERDRTKGLGLGLAIVRRTAALLRHTLALRSEEKQGTLFSLTVESSTANANQDIHATSRNAIERYNEQLPTSENTLYGQLILVVDDDTQNLTGLTMLFESWGHRVVAASSGHTLFEQVLHLNERPALIVSDYRLRDHETGVHLIKRLREEYNDQDLPALLVSGDTDPARLAEAAALGIPLLHKPVEVSALREKVTALLREHECRSVKGESE